MSVDAPSLLRWYAAQARDLPWRRDGVTGWQILMSEVMLQQTPVVRVAPIWEEWVQRWPVPSAMAASSQAEVLRAWGKLGYPRRALRLHECAGVLAAEHDDRVPEDVDVLLTLPGVGAYTAGSVCRWWTRMCGVSSHAPSTAGRSREILRPHGISQTSKRSFRVSARVRRPSPRR